MSWAPLSRVSESPSEREVLAGTLPIPDELEPCDYTILALLFRGVRLSEVARTLGRGEEECLARSLRPAFVDLQQDVKRGIVVQLTHANETEPVTLAKLHATGAMKRLIGLSKTATDQRVIRQANRDVLEFAGIEPAKRIEIVRPEQVLDRMTPAELHHYAETREWPERFATELRHLMAVRPGGGSVAVEQTRTRETTRTRLVANTPREVDERALDEQLVIEHVVQAIDQQEQDG